jgi:ABC-type transport system involved in Fe-S cluster assembly fused permease/ATPase subunit
LIPNVSQGYNNIRERRKKIMYSDVVVLKAAEIILLFVFFLSMLMELFIWIKKRRGGTSLTVKRGDHGMNFLYMMYGTVTILFALSVQVSEALKGYKVLLIVINYLTLTYLFFFNSWLRNRILFPILLRIEKD